MGCEYSCRKARDLAALRSGAAGLEPRSNIRKLRAPKSWVLATGFLRAFVDTSRALDSADCCDGFEGSIQ